MFFYQAVNMFENPYDMAKDSDALVVITEWNEFKQLDLERIHTLDEDANSF